MQNNFCFYIDNIKHLNKMHYVLANNNGPKLPNPGSRANLITNILLTL